MGHACTLPVKKVKLEFVMLQEQQHLGSILAGVQALETEVDSGGLSNSFSHLSSTTTTSVLMKASCMKKLIMAVPAFGRALGELSSAVDDDDEEEE